MAIFKLFRAFWYLITGRIDKIREGVESNPTAMKAQYDAVVKEKATRAKSFMDAVAGLMGSEENKKAKHAILLKEIAGLSKLREGALAKAKARANKLTADGKSQEDVKGDAEYIKHSSAYRDFTSTMKEKESRAEELEGEIGEIGKQVANYKTQLEGINREIDKLRDESLEAVADVSAAKEQENINKALSNISGDSTAEALNSLRSSRQQAKNRAKITGELAGTTAKAQEADYMEAAAASEADGELDGLIFGEAKETASATSEKLPE